MQFVDEAQITVRGGNGGKGCVSFRRERYISHGGPDGGSGGNGGSVYLVVGAGLNTLIEFRHRHLFEAEHGRNGAGKKRTGRSGKDLFINVPPGTLVYDSGTGELIKDLADPQAQVLVAHGGQHGAGNTQFKSSTNRTPRQATEGTDGEERHLSLELKLLADVGLVGLPNAGKSTLIAAVSSTHPKIADYPFTTLTPLLGVVAVEAWRSFVMADLPGLIAGAAQGAGLGTRFLRHIQRTYLLLHLVDIGNDPVMTAVQNIHTIEQELAHSNSDVFNYPRWLVCTKTDLLTDEEAQLRSKNLLEELNWEARMFTISAVTHQGTKFLTQAIMEFLEHERK